MHEAAPGDKAGPWVKVSRVAGRLDRALAALETGMIVLLLGAAAILNFSQVAARYLLDLSISSFEEISVYLIIWMVFLGAAHADRLGQNISLDLAYEYLPETAQRTLWRIADGALAALAAMLAYSAFDAVAFSRMLGETSVSRLSAPIWIIMAVMPAGFGIIALRAGARALRGRKHLHLHHALEMPE
jgi:TRAP-type C4-dicarboxylate transport system permease small subunit